MNQEDGYPPGGNGLGDVCDCEGDFDCDGDCDGSDAALFKSDFGRSDFNNPCGNVHLCNGDFDCDNDCDGTDASLFKQDFGRSSFNNPCPGCIQGEWCNYDCQTNLDCEEGFFCSKPTGQCDALGVCAYRPNECPAALDPVCGCDDITYDNALCAAVAGVSIDYLGECM